MLDALDDDITAQQACHWISQRFQVHSADHFQLEQQNLD